MRDNWFLSRPERRNNRRLDIELDVNLSINGTELNATTANISCGGMFLPIKQEKLKADTDIQVTLNLPDTANPVKVVGEISRLSSQADPSKGVAIRFRGLYDDNILAIDRFIKNKLN